MRPFTLQSFDPKVRQPPSPLTLKSSYPRPLESWTSFNPNQSPFKPYNPLSLYFVLTGVFHFFFLSFYPSLSPAAPLPRSQSAFSSQFVTTRFFFYRFVNPVHLSCWNHMRCAAIPIHGAQWSGVKDRYACRYVFERCVNVDTEIYYLSLYLFALT